MIRFAALLVALLPICFGASAQSIKAQDLEKFCAATGDSDRQACILIVKAYMDGFIEGVAKGVLDTYKYDTQILAMVKDVKMSDMAPRVGKVVETSTCIQRVSVAEMADAFVSHLRENPALRSENYRKAMTRMIVSKYCVKK